MNGPVARGSFITPMGTVDEKNRQALFHDLQEAAVQHAAGRNKRDHQYTPAMIEALLENVKAALDGEKRDFEHVVPKGGAANGQARDSAWSLVREVFRVSQ